MSKLNYIFFEEFKNLDKICKEIYNSDVGVTNYINDMKAVTKNESLGITNFEYDLKNLIHFRHIRNYLAHTAGGFDYEVCTCEDIEQIKNFYCRILTASDPLSVISKNRKKHKALLLNQYIKGPKVATCSASKTVSTKESFCVSKNWYIFYLIIFIAVVFLLICIV